MYECYIPFLAQSLADSVGSSFLSLNSLTHRPAGFCLKLCLHLERDSLPILQLYSSLSRARPASPANILTQTVIYEMSPSMKPCLMKWRPWSLQNWNSSTVASQGQRKSYNLYWDSFARALQNGNIRLVSLILSFFSSLTQHKFSWPITIDSITRWLSYGTKKINLWATKKTCSKYVLWIHWQRISLRKFLAGTRFRNCYKRIWIYQYCIETRPSTVFDACYTVHRPAVQFILLYAVGNIVVIFNDKNSEKSCENAFASRLNIYYLILEKMNSFADEAKYDISNVPAAQISQDYEEKRTDAWSVIENLSIVKRIVSVCKFDDYAPYVFYLRGSFFFSEVGPGVACSGSVKSGAPRNHIFIFVVDDFQSKATATFGFIWIWVQEIRPSPSNEFVSRGSSSPLFSILKRWSKCCGFQKTCTTTTTKTKASSCTSN